MKATFSEEHYRRNWDRFLEKVPGEHYINLEEALEREMTVYKGAELTEEAIQVIAKLEAQKLADKCLALVMKEMKTVKDLRAGRASLGYTTERQEYKARAELVERFEFNCLQLRDFKAKYGLQ